MKSILYGFTVFSWCLFYSQPHLLSVEDVFVCDNTSVRMYFDGKYNYSHSTAHSNGYFEVLRHISAEDNFEIAGEAYQKTGGKWAKNNQICMSKTNLCFILITDILLFPMIRKVVNLENHCPIKKGRYLIHSGRLVSKYHPILPYGCWKIVIYVEKPNSNHVEKLCILLNSAESLKSNDPIC
ncbi:uncharacterized protein LOC126840871 [Adelges cooleyi]|uniref:uncharacterized protein LOC126840871 n=1 Tax=Adelges cooleyi TaxID=133065 RepID=UPI00217FFA9A|nr:uncharacterized protein LOC126840871 [Adelges cooleyi]